MCVKGALGTSDLWPHCSLRRSSLFTGKGRTTSSPTRFSPSHIPVDAFPTVYHTHNSVLLGQISKDVGDRISGALPNTHGTWPWGNDTVSPFSAGQEKEGEGLDLGERSALASTAEKHLIVITHHSYFRDSFCAVSFTNCIRAISLKYLYIKEMIRMIAQQTQNTKRAAGEMTNYCPKRNLCNSSEVRVEKFSMLLFSGQRPTLAPDPFLRSVSKVDPEAESNWPWLEVWLGPFSTLALHLGPIVLLKKPKLPPTTWFPGVVQHSSTSTMTVTVHIKSLTDLLNFPLWRGCRVIKVPEQAGVLENKETSVTQRQHGESGVMWLFSSLKLVCVF